MGTPLTTPARTATARPSPAESAAALVARGVKKTFVMGGRPLEILHGIDLELARGELVALVGASGAGKSTLLHCLGVLDRPTEGKVWVEGVEAWSQSVAARAALRNAQIGFVFQFYHLLPELDALENVLLPAMIADSTLTFRGRRAEYRERAAVLLERFGLGKRLTHRPSQLSGGERQRVAMARALFRDPALLLADEPTGNLDTASGEAVLDLLLEEQRARELSMILVTHDERIARRCQRTLHMEDGRIAPGAPPA